MAKPITDTDVFFQITISQGFYELDSLIEENKMIINDESHFTEVDYPFTIKPCFSTLGRIIKFSRQEPSISFLPDDSIRNI